MLIDMPRRACLRGASVRDHGERAKALIHVLILIAYAAATPLRLRCRLFFAVALRRFAAATPPIFAIYFFATIRRFHALPVIKLMPRLLLLRHFEAAAAMLNIIGHDMSYNRPRRFH